METRWVAVQNNNNQAVNDLIQSLNIDEKLATLLVLRGVTNYEEAKVFFRPSLDYLHDPFLIKDMDKAVDRIEQAIQKGEKILIYGDYDVDGTTAVALIYNYLKNFLNKKKIEFYIPDRYTEGYGISFAGIDYAANNGFNLIIALDCGIKAVEKIDYANTKNIDFIICDHHRPGDTLPNAVAVLDSKRSDCNYPYKELSGCGVGFKLVSALSIRLKRPIEEVYELIDLVAVSIASDIVPITGENRVLAYFGLQKINENPRPGLEAILEHANIHRLSEEERLEVGETKNVLNRELTISDLVFMVGPRINAAGRIEKASDSVRLLIAGNTNFAQKLANNINDLNSRRREFDNRITEEALLMIESDEELRQAKSTVIFNEHWHKGVIGIVASRLTDYYYRPTIVLTKSDNLITGSARSIKNFDIYDAIDNCSDLLEHFGGHKYAAGLSLRPENLTEFRRRFEEYVSQHLEDDTMIPEIEIDTTLDFNEITPKFLRILKQFAPFGPGNMAPIFRADNVRDYGYSKAVGNNKHLKLSMYQGDKTDDNCLSGIAFQKGDMYNVVKNNPFSICYHIEENVWMGKTSLQLNVKDIKIISED